MKRQNGRGSYQPLADIGRQIPGHHEACARYEGESPDIERKMSIRTQQYRITEGGSAEFYLQRSRCSHSAES